ncbi:19061_t:CDS:2, partial [Racocetra fulgida]
SEDGSEVEVRNCFPVPHDESQNQVAVDMVYHQSMFELHKKVNAKEVIVGWYATGSNLNQWNALIQDFYSKEVSPPFQAIHLTMNTDLKNEEKLLGVKTYVSAPIGISAKPENCLFLPVPCDVKYFDAERSGHRSTSLISDMDNLEKTILVVQEMLERVSEYVNKVLVNKPNKNELMVMKMSQLHKTQNDGGNYDTIAYNGAFSQFPMFYAFVITDDSDNDSDSNDGVLDENPILEIKSLKHYGGANRVRMMPQKDCYIAATWAETGKVLIWDLAPVINSLDTPGRQIPQKTQKPIYTVESHSTEGFAMDWSGTVAG